MRSPSRLCDKPVAARFWPYDGRARRTGTDWCCAPWIDDDVLYQEGTLAGLMHPDDLAPLAQPALAQRNPDVLRHVRRDWRGSPARLFRYQLEDPVLGRAIDAAYGMRTLPLIS